MLFDENQPGYSKTFGKRKKRTRELIDATYNTALSKAKEMSDRRIYKHTNPYVNRTNVMKNDIPTMATLEHSLDVHKDRLAKHTRQLKSVFDKMAHCYSHIDAIEYLQDIRGANDEEIRDTKRRKKIQRRKERQEREAYSDMFDYE